MSSQFSILKLINQNTSDINTEVKKIFTTIFFERHSIDSVYPLLTSMTMYGDCLCRTRGASFLCGCLQITELYISGTAHIAMAQPS